MINRLDRQLDIDQHELDDLNDEESIRIAQVRVATRRPSSINTPL